MSISQTIQKSVSRAGASVRLIALLLAAIVFPQAGFVSLGEGTTGELDELSVEVQGAVRVERLAPESAPRTRRESLPLMSTIALPTDCRLVHSLNGHLLPSGQRAPLTC